MQKQVYIFIIFILNGILIGIVFDIFRILRKSFKTSDIVTYIEDVLFGIISGLLMLFSILKFNNGEIRLYLFIGIFIGLILYMLLFSKIFIKTSVELIKIIKKSINYIIIIPTRFFCNTIRRIIIKPIFIICLNIKNLITKIKIPKLKFNTKFYKKNQK